MRKTAPRKPLPPYSAYRSPAWLPGGHLQTLYPLLIKPRPPAYTRERWDTPDGDFIDVDWLSAPVPATAQDPATPLVVLFHGLEGSSRSHYAVSLMQALAHLGWQGAVPHFRGCSGELNRLPRAYHSGDSAEIQWVLERFRQRYPHAPLYAVGVSLGGNALLKWLGERADTAQALIQGAASVCAPLDLTLCGHALARGFNRLYTANFMGTLKRRALLQARRFPGLLDTARVKAARNLHDFDEAVTAPMHGFANADDYWRRCSSKPWLAAIRVPTLVLNSRNDPFLPAAALPSPAQVSPQVHLELPGEGGHVGFVAGTLPGRLDWLPHRLLHFFRNEIPQ